jgi:phosphoribosylaminoimidazole-succinocarboxamide synthase
MKLRSIYLSHILGITKMKEGKVREVFSILPQKGENEEELLLLVATDRISAFDQILPDLIPHKGEVLTQLSAFWFSFLKEQLGEELEHHVIMSDFDQIAQKIPRLASQRISLEGRSMLVKKTKPLPVECIVRGYLAGSAVKEYQTTKSLWGEALPEGLEPSQQLPEPLFTPTTKSLEGHDTPLSWEGFVQLLGEEVATQVRTKALAIYEAAAAYAQTRGVIIADTKMEFGWYNNQLLLIDECLTPDSSRFWLSKDWKVGATPPNYDKQLVRDFLTASDWDKEPPAPSLPEEIIEKSSALYQEIFKKLTGSPLPQLQQANVPANTI